MNTPWVESPFFKELLDSKNLPATQSLLTLSN